MKKRFLLIFSMTLMLGLLLSPSQSIEAAKIGLLLWFNTVLPTLLPFIMASNLLMASGSLSFFQKIFGPLMNFFFKLPGSAAFPWVMGLISGYPMGAKVAGELYQNKQINNTQMQRLISFCNNSGPFFILGAVGIGMLGDQQAGYFLLFVHIISSVLVGILFRFYGKESAHVPLSHVGPVKKLESLGEIFGSSISNSMDTIVQIGGYIILFSVIGALLRQSRIIKSLSSFLYYVFKPLGMTMELAFSWIIGLIEISNGSSLVAQSQGLYPLKLGVLSFILGWGGLSIHAQSLNFTKKTKIKAPVYLFAKFLHGAIAFILTLVLYFLLAYFITS